MKTTILSLIFLCLGIFTVEAQISEKQLHNFIPDGYTLSVAMGDGLNRASGDILLVLVSIEPDDFERLVLLHKEKGKLSKIAENGDLLMSKDILGVLGATYPSLSENILSVDYSQGSHSYSAEISIKFEKNKNGQYEFASYTAITKIHGVEHPNERKKVTAAQTGIIGFAEATEHLILERATK